MNETVKLFYKDSHIKEFDAVVLSCEEEKGGYKVVLDETAFFPEGGGQYGDVGTLDEAAVLDTKEKEGLVYHKTDKPLEVGQKVHGKINWDVRFERMQQHSGEHIVSGLINKRFGYNNVGFHLGDDYCTMDFNGPITKEELKEIERQANEAIYKDIPVEILYPTKEELKDLTYRSKIEIEGQVRITKIPGYDICACCAPHVHSTGQIGMIKLTDMINYKGGERITLQAGVRALRDYDGKHESVREIGALLCEKETQVADAVARMKNEQSVMKSKMASLLQKLVVYKAAEVEIQDEITAVFDEELTGNGPREFMNLILDRGAKICAVFAGNEKDGYRYVIGSHTEDVRGISKELNAKFNGRGGGKPEMVQGSLTGEREEILNALNTK